MGTPITIVIVDDFAGYQWQVIPATVWYREHNDQIASWWRVFAGPPQLSSYEIIPIPVFTEWWS